MTFGERLTYLRKENGYSTRKEFANFLGIPETTLRNYEKDEREPGHTFLKNISELFDVSADYLLGLKNDKEKTDFYQLKKSEYKIIENYRTLDSFGKETVDWILNRELGRKEYFKTASEINTSDSPARFIQYYRKVSAGTGEIIFDDADYERIEIPDIQKYRKVAYAVKVSGHSMEPLYQDGDLLLVEPACTIDVGQIGIFNVDNLAFVKKLGEKELISLNKGYNNIPLTDSARCMGRVIDKFKKGD